jgi:hypothetical protein
MPTDDRHLGRFLAFEDAGHGLPDFHRTLSSAGPG